MQQALHRCPEQCKQWQPRVLYGRLHVTMTSLSDTGRSRAHKAHTELRHSKTSALPIAAHYAVRWPPHGITEIIYSTICNYELSAHFFKSQAVIYSQQRSYRMIRQRATQLSIICKQFKIYTKSSCDVVNIWISMNPIARLILCTWGTPLIIAISLDIQLRSLTAYVLPVRKLLSHSSKSPRMQYRLLCNHWWRDHAVVIDYDLRTATAQQIIVKPLSCNKVY